MYDTEVMKYRPWVQSSDSMDLHLPIINVRENRRDNQEWTIQRNRQHWVHKTQDEDEKKSQTKTTHTTIGVGHHYAQTYTYNVNKT